MLAAALASLPERVAAIVRARYMDNSDSKAETLSVIGERFGLSRERVRQLEAQGVQALRVIVPQMRGERTAPAPRKPATRVTYRVEDGRQVLAFLP